jgi:CDGSH-type Zn-finger protein
MPEHQFSSSETRGKIRTRVTLKRGEAISLCRCWHSQNFPLCDGSHKNLGDKKGPVVIHTDCEQAFIHREEG